MSLLTFTGIIGSLQQQRFVVAVQQEGKAFLYEFLQEHTRKIPLLKLFWLIGRPRAVT
jgi:hypothetical protein